MTTVAYHFTQTHIFHPQDAKGCLPVNAYLQSVAK